MLRKSLDKGKPKHKKAFSKLDLPIQPSNQITMNIIVSSNQVTSVMIPINCPLKMINFVLRQKVAQLRDQIVIGVQTVPANYNLDYLFSKDIGILENVESIQLRCMYKNTALQQRLQRIENDSIGQHKFRIRASSKTHQIMRKNKTANNSNVEFYSSHRLIKYKICKSLSSGGFSRVYLVRNLINGEFYAAKFMDKTANVNVDRRQSIQNQFHIHKSFSHPFIVRMEEYIETQQFYILIMEYCPGGQLFTLLKNNRYMDENKARVLFMQSLLAIKHLHDSHIIFRDIKPENILIDVHGNAKLTDFGLAKKIRNRTSSYCGSVEYMAPQVVMNQMYSFEIDLYCMGALLYEILVGCPPFYNPNFSNNETKYHICNSQIGFPSNMDLSDEVRDIISRLLVKDPSNRLGYEGGVTEILTHPWLQGVQIDSYLKLEIKSYFVPDLQIENFDRQDDPYEAEFREKIQKNMTACKKNFSAEAFDNKKNSRSNSSSNQKSPGHVYSGPRQLFSRSKSQYGGHLQRYFVEKQKNNKFKGKQAKLKQNSIQNFASPYQAALLKSSSLFLLAKSSNKWKKQSGTSKSSQIRKQYSSLNSIKNRGFSRQGKRPQATSLFIQSKSLNSQSYSHSRANSTCQNQDSFKRFTENTGLQLQTQKLFKKQQQNGALRQKQNKEKNKSRSGYINSKQSLHSRNSSALELRGSNMIEQKQNLDEKNGLRKKCLKQKGKFKFPSSVKEGKKI